MPAIVWHDRAMSKPARSDRSIFVVLLVLVSSVYFATFVGVTSSNDGSHYALLRAQFSSGVIEIGRGVAGAYILPFAPLIAALALLLFGTAVFAYEAVRR